MARALILIPILHSQADMGSMAGAIEQRHAGREGAERWRAQVDFIAKFWAQIRVLLAELRLPRERLRLYQDGLPVCGREAELVKELAAGGSANHQLLLELMADGAQLEGTEDPRWLLEEYRLHEEEYRLKKAPPDAQRAERLLAERDRAIAGRINATLRENEIGLLFIGALHAVEKFLEPDIAVRNPLPSLSQLRVAT